MDDDGGIALEVLLVERGEAGDDDLVAGAHQAGGGAIHLHRARSLLALDRVGHEPGTIVDVPDVNLLVDQQVRLPHQLGIQGDAADVVDVTVRDRRAMDLRLDHLTLHQPSVFGVITTLSMRRAVPTRAATATSTGRPFSSSIGERSSAARASTYSGSIPELRSSFLAFSTRTPVEVSPASAARSAARRARAIAAACSRCSVVR